MKPESFEKISVSLLANFVHQIINPLNGVMGTIDNVIDGSVDKAKVMQRLKRARSQLEWTTMLIRNLAYFTETSMEPGKDNKIKTSEVCTFPQLIIDAIQMFQESAASKGVEIELTDPKTQYQTKGSSDLLSQVFVNVLDNAVKYSDNGTSITVTPRIQNKTNDLFIEIQNHGIGFSFQESTRLFEATFRREAAVDKVRSGTGLGLYICKKIIEDQHGGEITAEHIRAKGVTTIRLRFPSWSVQGDKFHKRP